MGVVIGVDSHKSSLAVGVIDELGRVLAAREFSNDGRGHESLLAWIDQHGMERTIGIEGSGSYGVGLTRRLIGRNERVFEVPAFISHRERKKRPARGKSDPDDAIAIARVVARGEGLSSPARTDLLEDLKLLSDHRDQLVRTRTRMINRTHRDLVVTCPGYERRIPKLTSKKRLAEARRLLRSDDSVRAELIRERMGEITRLNDKIAAVGEEDRAQGEGVQHHAHPATGRRFHRRRQDFG
jgi:transposase